MLDSPWGIVGNAAARKLSSLTFQTCHLRERRREREWECKGEREGEREWKKKARESERRWRERKEDDRRSGEAWQFDVSSRLFRMWVNRQATLKPCSFPSSSEGVFFLQEDFYLKPTNIKHPNHMKPHSNLMLRISHQAEYSRFIHEEKNVGLEFDSKM